MIAKKKIFDIVLKTFGIFTVLHIAILGVYAAATGNISVFNLYDILEIDLLFSLPHEGWVSGIFSSLAPSVAYILAYFM